MTDNIVVGSVIGTVFCLYVASMLFAYRGSLYGAFGSIALVFVVAIAYGVYGYLTENV